MKNKHLPIRVGIQEALKELKALRDNMEDTDCYLDSFEYLLRPKSTLDMRKWLRESIASLEETKTKKPAEKRPKASKKEEEWVEVPTRKDLRKKKQSKPENRRTERRKRTQLRGYSN